MNKVISIIYIFIGVGIIGLWIMLLATNQVPELETTPVSIAFHIVIEMLMALMCLLTGVTNLKQCKIKEYILFLTNGMLIYSVVNSSGYYAELGDYGMLIMFSVILVFVILTSYNTINMLKKD